MKTLIRRLGAGVVAVALVSSVAVFGISTPASAAEEVIPVQTKDEALPGTVWTPGVLNSETCMVTDTGVHTQPGEEHEATYETQNRYSQVIPGQAEVSHTEYKYQRTVIDYKTQYHFAKFTREKTKTADTPGFWQEFSPTKPKTFNGPPLWPTDERGKWSAKKYNGGPQQDASGVFQNGGGNGSWFYRAQTVPGVWSDFGPWTKWTPETHTSWEDSDAPLGTPQLHAQGANFYREWQARFDGQTRQVENGSHVETTGWLTAPPVGDGWIQIDEKSVVDSPKTDDKTVYYLPGGGQSDTLTDANWTIETPGQPWVFVDTRQHKTADAYTDPDVVTRYSHTYKSDDCPVVPPNRTVTGDKTYTVVCTDEVGDVIFAQREVTIHTYSVVDNKVVENKTTRFVNTTHKVTAEDVAGLDCPVATPPTEAPSARLAATGLDGWGVAGIALTAIVLLGAGTVLILSRRRKA